MKLSHYLPACLIALLLAIAFFDTVQAANPTSPPDSPPIDATEPDPPPAEPRRRLLDMAEDVEAPTTDVPRDSCVTAECHPETKSREYLHGPLHVNACDSCHTLIDPALHQYEDTRSPTEMCVFCHQLSIPEDVLLHKPLETGECLPCHDPHGGSGPNLLRGEQYSALCRSCHEDLVGDRMLRHGPASAGACGACHEPHFATHPKLLAAEGKDLCVRCHLTTQLRLENQHLVHEPAADDCQICHDPHATDNEKLLVDDAVALCLSCHAGVEHTIETATTPHEGVTAKKACLNCHDAHASDHPRLLKDNVADLCFECHNTEIELTDGTTLSNMKAIIDTGTSLHGALAEKNCAACHQIHGGQRRRLLSAEYPEGVYQPFVDNAYHLCFDCHDRQVVLAEETSVVTQFRNGSQNLHFVHVNRGRKGRSCRICHDAHAVEGAKHIRPSIAFGPGGWQLPIEFEQLEDGGRCAAGCHPAYEYNRVDPVDYVNRVDGEQWQGEDLVPGVRAGSGEKDGDNGGDDGGDNNGH